MSYTSTRGEWSEDTALLSAASSFGPFFDAEDKEGLALLVVFLMVLTLLFACIITACQTSAKAER